MSIKTYSMSDSEWKHIAYRCKCEQGTVTGAKAEASLMANRYELYGSKYSSLYNYVTQSGWFAHATTTGSVADSYVTAVKDVLANGNRTIPTCVIEHDCFSDIKKITNNGTSVAVRTRSNYIQGTTKIYNNYGATYTFYCFPDTNSDPFGYTDSSYKSTGGFIMPDGTTTAAGSAGTSGSVSGLYEGGYLYDRDRYKDDAIMREVSYWDKSKNEPTLTSSKIKCAVINYTDELSAFLVSALGYSSSSTNSASGTSVDTSKVSDTKARSIIETITGFGLNAAAACGITGNIYYESNYDPAAIGDNGTSFGLCQWHNERGTNMKNYVADKYPGTTWKTNTTGQLNFLWYELSNSYKSSVLAPLQVVTNTSDGAKSAADTFVRKFEVPANVSSESTKRQSKAAELFSELVLQV